MFLHKDRELFREAVFATSAALSLPVAVIEKDYYVTMLLRSLAQKAPDCVFKGGTSLSKCFQAIDRFSEDIDIAFSNRLTGAQRRDLKNTAIAGISAELDLPIADWANARSRRDYNCYTFAYQPLQGFVPESLIQGVKMEVSLVSLSYPTEKRPVDSFLHTFLARDNADLIEPYGLAPFEMNVQSLSRTLADKVFTLCDYYMQGSVKRHSRHIYDIAMLLPLVPLDEAFVALVRSVRADRAALSICPSACPGVSVPALLQKIIAEGVYREDYRQITAYFQRNPVAYETVIQALQQIVESGAFAE